MVLILQAFLAFVLLFVVCEIGQQTTDAFNEVEYAIDRLDWYLYPIKMQKMLVPIMVYAQKPVDMEFFGSFTCNRDQFKKARLNSNLEIESIDLNFLNFCDRWSILAIHILWC